MAKETKPANQVLFESLADGPATASSLKSALKMEDPEFDAFIAAAKARLWVEEDDSGKTTKYALADMGRMEHARRYPDSVKA